MDGLGISDDVDGTFASSAFNFCICAPTSRFPNPKLFKLERGDVTVGVRGQLFGGEQHGVRVEDRGEGQRVRGPGGEASHGERVRLRA